MVGLADIPCVGKFVERVSEYTVDAVFRGLKYMFRYKALVNDLNSEIRKLNTEEKEMSTKVKKEENNGKIIKEDVLKWQSDAEEIQKSAEELSPSCSCIQRLPIPNPISRFRIGRNAVKKAETVTQLTISRKEWVTREIAYLPEVTYMPKSDTAFEEFQSRKDAYKKLWDALVTEDSHLICGIYGMAGVGKTRIMEQFWEEAMKKKIFDKVVRVNVGNEKLDNIKLQDQVAGRLDCKLESQDLERRASQLENSLRNGGKILFILDDVWWQIHLNDIIGTSFGDGSSSKGSKILLTSREKEVCLLNKCEHLVEIKTLSPDEALDLFKKAVGPHTIYSLPDQSLVKKVCDKCGHLPLLIHAVGKALKGKSRNSWTDAHNQLMEGKFEKIAGVDPKVYTGIKLSIDYLQNDDTRSCLFLCSMFPEDADIDMKMLIQLATGSELGESRILATVEYLKISSLLLDSEKENDKIKVHDIIRDVARSVAFTDPKYAFLHETYNYSRYLPCNANYRTRRFLSLDAETDDVHFDEHMECPYLHTLWLQSNYHRQEFSGGFFSMFANLSCLMLQKVNISLEQFSLQPLGNLGTLSLLECDVRNTDGSLFPSNLTTLCICECELPNAPLDVANLKCLRKLEIQQRGPVLVMVNVISNLSSLEELHISNGFTHDHDQYHLEPIVMEISKLTRLTSLHFLFYEDYTFRGTDILLFSNIDRYNLFVGTPKHHHSGIRDWRVPLTRSIELYGNHSKSWEGLMARAEEVTFSKSDVEVSSICNGHRGAFQDLKRLFIHDCDKMGHLASKSQDEIQYSLESPTCFSKLTNLGITRCSKLKYLFCSNIAKSLRQLQELSVQLCFSMEAIIMNQGTSDGEIINFSKLKSLKISDNSWRLTSFYKENSAYPSAQCLSLFHGMVTFPSLEYIDVSKCSGLRSMFSSPSVASDFTHLKEMKVHDCGEMREIIGVGEQAVITDGILFPELTALQLSKLPRLTSFWCYQSEKANTCKVPLRLPQLSSIVLWKLLHLKSFFQGANFEFHMPALKEVIVDNCGFLTLFTISVLRKSQLEKLQVRKCNLLESIVEDLRGDETCDKIITLSQLAVVHLERLPNLKSFFHNANYHEFHMPALKEVRVGDCGLSNTLFTRSDFQNLKQLEELSVSDCKLLEGIFEDAREDETLDTSDKIITLNRVSSVRLERLPKLKSIFYGATYECHMPALRHVGIVGCEVCILFTCSVFREIRQLERLFVTKCQSLERIIEEVRGEETSEINGKSITSSQLSGITLYSLPNLKSFSCTSSYVFNMPKLKEFRLIECPQIEYFSSSKTNTSLVRVTSDWCKEEGFQDLNDLITQNHKRESERIEEEKSQKTETQSET